MKGKDLIGSLSPLYGMASGHGMFGEIGPGLIPSLARKSRKDKKDGVTPVNPAEEAAAPGMKKGGSARAGGKTRGDGICKKGHTKGKMV
jgi:hypothetical protein